MNVQPILGASTSLATGKVRGPNIFRDMLEEGSVLPPHRGGGGGRTVTILDPSLFPQDNPHMNLGSRRGVQFYNAGRPGHFGMGAGGQGQLFNPGVIAKKSRTMAGARGAFEESTLHSWGAHSAIPPRPPVGGKQLSLFGGGAGRKLGNMKGPGWLMAAGLFVGGRMINNVGEGGFGGVVFGGAGGAMSFAGLGMMAGKAMASKAGRRGMLSMGTSRAGVRIAQSFAKNKLVGGMALAGAVLGALGGMKKMRSSQAYNQIQGMGY